MHYGRAREQLTTPPSEPVTEWRTAEVVHHDRVPRDSSETAEEVDRFRLIEMMQEERTDDDVVGALQVVGEDVGLKESHLRQADATGELSGGGDGDGSLIAPEEFDLQAGSLRTSRNAKRDVGVAATDVEDAKSGETALASDSLQSAPKVSRGEAERIDPRNAAERVVEGCGVDPRFVHQFRHALAMADGRAARRGRRGAKHFGR